MRACWLWIVLLAGCAGSQLGTGSVRWRVVETEHFKLHTDFDQAGAEERADELERVLHAFASSAFVTKGKLPLKLNVVMFSEQRAFDEYGKDKAAGYIVHDILYEPWVVMPAPRGSDAMSTLTHELTHYIAYAAMSRQPAWFAEGLASYFETARFESYGSVFVVGKPPLGRHALLSQRRVIPPSELIAKEAFHSDSLSYSSAWLLVHYLMTRRSEQFADYQGKLAKGLGFTRAFEEAFQGLSLTELDQEVYSYFEYGLYEAVVFRIAKQPRAAMKSRTLSVADEYALRGMLLSTCMYCGPADEVRSRESLGLALAADPLNLRAQLLTITNAQDSLEALDAAQRLTKAYPQEWLAWLQLGFTASRVGSGGLADQGAARALELAPSQAYAWMLRAQRYAAHGEREPALKAAERARRLQRNSPDILLKHGAILAQFGECSALQDVVARVRDQPELAIDERNRSWLAERLQSCSP